MGWADDEQKNKSYNRTKMKQKHNVTAEKLGIEISTGTLAGLASGAVTISMGETNVFVSATAAATVVVCVRGGRLAAYRSTESSS